MKTSWSTLSAVPVFSSIHVREFLQPLALCLTKQKLGAVLELREKQKTLKEQKIQQRHIPQIMRGSAIQGRGGRCFLH